MVSAQQYLCSDYINALAANNSPLDANKSPLAMLARTCDNIGGGGGPASESSSANFLQQTKSKQNGSLSLISNNHHHHLQAKRSLQPQTLLMNGSVDKSSTSSDYNQALSKRFKHDLANNVNGSSSHKNGIGSAQKLKETLPKKTKSDGDKPTSIELSKSATPNKMLNDMPNLSRDVHPHSPSTSNPVASLPTSLPTPTVSVPSLLNFYQSPQSMGFTMPPGLSLPTLPAYSFGAGLPCGTGGFPRFCTDPNCKTCPMGSPFAFLPGIGPPTASSMFPPTMMTNHHALRGAGALCPPGCSQCSLDNTAGNPWLTSYYMMQLAQANLQTPMMPSSTSMWNSLFTPTSNGLVCGWLNGDKVCGKVAQNYDEFLQHLRSHTAGHICHWNTGEKYCGKVYASQEELAHHLRLHSQESLMTSLAHQQQSSPLSSNNNNGGGSPPISHHLKPNLISPSAGNNNVSSSADSGSPRSTSSATATTTANSFLNNLKLMSSPLSYRMPPQNGFVPQLPFPFMTYDKVFGSGLFNGMPK